MTTKSKPWQQKETNAMDTWLDTQGFYRKHIARDGSCLFRCVSEQVFLTQAYHLTVRKHCIQFALNQPKVFEQLTDIPVKQYVARLQNLNECGTSLDIEIISRMYNVDFAIFKEIKKPIEQVTSNECKSFIMLSMQETTEINVLTQYDSVYPKEHINVNAAICQSILYEKLYKDVFKLEEVDYVVNKMLHDKSSRFQSEINAFYTGFQMRLEMRDNCKNVKDLYDCGITPFPYRVAKCLDPNIYRNVEQDTWNDTKKVRHNSSSWNNRKLQEGAHCWVYFKGEHENIRREGYIQKMSPNKGPVEVYIPELVKKEFVPYENLELIPDSSSCSNNVDGMFDAMRALRMNNKVKVECSESKPSLPTFDENMQHSRKMVEVYPSVTSTVHYVHSTTSTVPTTCYACVTSQNYTNENDRKPLLQVDELQTPEMASPSDEAVSLMQYPVPLHPLMPQDVEIQPPMYSANVLPPKTVTSVNETNCNDMGNPLRVYYNNVDYYRYGVSTVPYYVVSPNYIIPMNSEPPPPQNSDVPRIQYTPPASQYQNEIVYTMPMNSAPNQKTDLSAYPPVVTYPVISKKPPLRNAGEIMKISEPSFRLPKETVYVKETPPVNPINVAQPSIPSNIYPYFNNPYSSITPPLYYPYDYNTPCYSTCPELPSYPDIATSGYQMPLVPYTDDMYPTNGQFICQPMLPASH